MNHLEWHGPEATGHVRERALKALARAASVVERRAKELLSVPGTRKGKDGRRVYGAERSAPGEPPRKQTGRLRSSVSYEIDEHAMSARVGTNVKYGMYLELGTRRGLAPRPWLRRALAEMAGKVNEMLSGVGP